jgi:MoaA/NifB/PqqE/SkfB family radical SAM enzyme
MDLISLQRFVPARMRYFLKPYYRRIIRNRLVVLFQPTFRCNYRCSYCPVVTKFDYTTVFPRKSERTAQDWVAILEKLPPAMIYIAGGEPMVYAPLPDVINNLPKKHEVVGMVTNVSLPTSLYRKIRKRIHINASFHREFAGEDEFIEKVKELQHLFHLAVNIVATPENLPVIERLDALMRSRKIVLHVDPLVDADFSYTPEQKALLLKHTHSDRQYTVAFDDFSVKRCSAGRNYIYVMPGGEVYSCAGGCSYIHSPLFKHLAQGADVSHYFLGNLFDPAFQLNKDDMTCTLPCKDACDRDSAIIKVIAPAPAQLPVLTR